MSQRWGTMTMERESGLELSLARRLERVVRRQMPRAWRAVLVVAMCLAMCVHAEPLDNGNEGFAGHKELADQARQRELDRWGIQVKMTKAEEGLWLEAYVLPYSLKRVPPNKGADPEGFVIAMIAYRLEYIFSNATERIGELQNACVIDDTVQSSQVWIRENFKEERGQFPRWGAALVFCIFDFAIVERYFESVAHFRHVIQFLDMRTDFAQLLRPYMPRGLTVCVPTLFGDQYVLQPRRLRAFIAQYAQYYRREHGMERLFIYSDNEALVRIIADADPDLQVIFLDRWNRKSHYHGQRLAQLDCWLRALQLNSEWTLFVDLDEVLTWPFQGMTWSEIFGESTQALSFGSERAFSAFGDSAASTPVRAADEISDADGARGANQDDFEFSVVNIKRIRRLWVDEARIAQAGEEGLFFVDTDAGHVEQTDDSTQLDIVTLDALYRWRSETSEIESCINGFFGARKYAMRGNVWNGYWPNAVHDYAHFPKGLYRGYMCDTDSSGVFLKHFPIAKTFTKLLMARVADTADDPEYLDRVLFSPRIAPNIPRWSRDGLLNSGNEPNETHVSAGTGAETGPKPKHPLDRLFCSKAMKRSPVAANR